METFESVRKQATLNQRGIAGDIGKSVLEWFRVGAVLGLNATLSPDADI
jgi:hypothetical protein